MSRRKGTTDISVEVPKDVAKKYAAVFTKHSLAERADDIARSIDRYGASEVAIDLQGLPKQVLEEMIPASGDRKGIVTLLKGFIRVLSDPKSKVGNLRLLPAALAKYLVTDAIDGWVYWNKEGEERLAYLVDSIEYHEGERESPASVTVSLKANRAAVREGRGNNQDVHGRSLTFRAGNIVGKSAADVLLEAGWLKETAELKAEYVKYFDRFKEYVPRMYEQFVTSGDAVSADSTSYRTERYFAAKGTRIINDEHLASRPITMRGDNEFWQEYIKGLDEGGVFSEIPVHPFMLGFDLERHQYAWFHIGNIEPYKYDAGVRNKLILPQEHRDLIDILTTDLSVFEEDIVRGKSGGTPILCYGKPGLGKTLTAEVYSEIIGKPLYRVDAGQLGTTIKEVEENLETVLKRAERWGAIMLIDEADVYIRRRGDDMNQNAIVAAFLRTLEYFNGLLFMTTNRIDDVDDAIISRMVALFKYETPTEDMRPKLWRVLAAQFDCKLAATVQGLAEAFADASGRDIKQLLRLTKRYCEKKKRPMDVDAFRICAMFRGLK